MFFEILELMNFDWNKAVEVFCNYNDYQIEFINRMVKKRNKLREAEMKMQEKRAKYVRR